MPSWFSPSPPTSSNILGLEIPSWDPFLFVFAVSGVALRHLHLFPISHLSLRPPSKFVGFISMRWGSRPSPLPPQSTCADEKRKIYKYFKVSFICLWIPQMWKAFMATSTCFTSHGCEGYTVSKCTGSTMAHHNRVSAPFSIFHCTDCWNSDTSVKPVKTEGLVTGVSTLSPNFSWHPQFPKNMVMDTRAHMRAFLFKVWNQRFQLRLDL